MRRSPGSWTLSKTMHIKFSIPLLCPSGVVQLRTPCPSDVARLSPLLQYFAPSESMRRSPGSWTLSANEQTDSRHILQYSMILRRRSTQKPSSKILPRTRRSKLLQILHDLQTTLDPEIFLEDSPSNSTFQIAPNSPMLHDCPRQPLCTRPSEMRNDTWRELKCV